VCGSVSLEKDTLSEVPDFFYFVDDLHQFPYTRLTRVFVLFMPPVVRLDTGRKRLRISAQTSKRELQKEETAGFSLLSLSDIR